MLKFKRLGILIALSSLGVNAGSNTVAPATTPTSTTTSTATKATPSQNCIPQKAHAPLKKIKKTSKRTSYKKKRKGSVAPMAQTAKPSVQCKPVTATQSSYTPKPTPPLVLKKRTRRPLKQLLRAHNPHERINNLFTPPLEHSFNKTIDNITIAGLPEDVIEPLHPEEPLPPKEEKKPEEPEFPHWIPPLDPMPHSFVPPKKPPVGNEEPPIDTVGTVDPVPEPETYMLMGIGLAALYMKTRHKKSAKKQE